MRDKSISIRLLIQTAFQKWRRMLVCGLIFMVLASGWKAYHLWSVKSGMEQIKSQSSGSENINDSSHDPVSSGADYQKSGAYFRQQIENASEYINKSFYTQMDPNAVGMATADISVSTPELENENESGNMMLAGIGSINGTESGNAGTTSSSDENTVVVTTAAEQDANTILNAYKEFILYGVDWTSIAKKYDTEPQYLQELVNLNGDQISGTYSTEIMVRFPTEQGAGELLDEIIAQVQNYSSTVTQSYGEHSIKISNRITSTATDPSVTDKINSRLSTLNSMINGSNSFGTATAALGMTTDSTKNETNSVSTIDLLKPVVKYAGIGFVGGIVAYLILVILSLLASGKIYSASEMNRQYGFSKIAVVPPSNVKKIKGIDRLTHRDAVDYYSSIDRIVCWQIADENLSELINGKGTVALIGDVNPGQLQKIAVEINKGTSDFQVNIPGDILNSPDALRSLKETDAAVIVAQVGTSGYRNTDRILEILQTYGKTILGSIIVDK